MVKINNQEMIKFTPPLSLTRQEYRDGDEEPTHGTRTTHAGLLEIFVGPAGRHGVTCQLNMNPNSNLPATAMGRLH